MSAKAQSKCILNQARAVHGDASNPKAGKRCKEWIVNQLQSQDVVLGTLCSMDSQLLWFGGCSAIVLDENAQSTEPESCCALKLADILTRVILIGDHMQLPAIVVSPSACWNDLDRSLFERLFYDPSISDSTLTKQYRMVHDIRDFPSLQFYRGSLTDARCTTGKGLISGFPWPNGKPLCFIHVSN